ncbi:acetyl-CoA carboxylase, biotin carboxyl carrier protein [Sporomusaceae bacterium FL31]|nr:acetyl-CoA carboxylase, biotin carboxyl carrier protein [Sporomusaceae bacterium FL31]GCE34447.1 acetyl-CoA carboxylase, biotin carboxyl carrier protein [Sporomusaceae bacterium]
MLNIEDITTIIKLIDQSSLTRFELEYESTKLVLVKAGAAAISDIPAATVLQHEQLVKDPSSGMAAWRVEKTSQTDAKEALHTITAPMIGTFYAAAEPGAEPFIQIGQKIAADQIVCILEAMKLFNETEAGIAGEIVSILAKDGDFVEYGQPLFVVKPD